MMLVWLMALPAGALTAEDVKRMPANLKDELYAINSGNYTDWNVVHIVQYFLTDGDEENARNVLAYAKETNDYSLPYYAAIKRQLGMSEEADALVKRAFDSGIDFKSFNAKARVEMAKYFKKNNGDQAQYKKYIENIAKDFKKLSAQDELWVVEELKAIGKPKDAEKILKAIDNFNLKLDENLAVAKYYHLAGDQKRREDYFLKAFKQLDLSSLGGVKNTIETLDECGENENAIDIAKQCYAVFTGVNIDGDLNYTRVYNWLNDYLAQKGQMAFIDEQKQIAKQAAEEEAIKGLEERMRNPGMYRNYDGDTKTSDYLMLKANKGNIADREGAMSYMSYLKDYILDLQKSNNCYHILWVYEHRDELGDEAIDFVPKTDSLYDEDCLNMLLKDGRKDILEWYYPIKSEQYTFIDPQLQETFEKVDSLLYGNTGFEVGSFRYKKSGKYLYAEYIGNAATVTFPTKVTYDGKVMDVEGVGGAPDNKTLISVVIPEGVKAIANKAFNGCTKLTTIKVPSSLVSAGYEAFANCPALTAVTNFNFASTDQVANAVAEFLADCYESPKMVDPFIKQVLARYEPEDLMAYTKHWLFKDSYGYDFMIGKYYASKVIGKKILVGLAAKGNSSAMIDICNYFLDDNPIFTASDYLKYAKLLISKEPAFGYYFMGNAYENGYGVTRSRTQAHSYYAKGRQLNDKDCDRGWWRTL